MRTTALWKLWMLLFVCGLAACGEDDIYFTQDELVEGDILTGKQVRLEDNTLVVYTGMSDLVNVRGAKGVLTVKSADAEIATATEYEDAGTHRVEVQGRKEGNTVISVTDSKGNTAGFAVTVRNAEELWHPCFTCERDEELRHVRCLVAGVSSADSVAVANDAYARNPDYRFVLKFRFLAPSNVYRMLVYDAGGKLLVDGWLRSSFPPGDKEGYFEWEVYPMSGEVLPAKYAYTETGGSWIIKDLTEEYRTKYPSADKVELWFPVKTVKEKKG